MNIKCKIGDAVKAQAAIVKLQQLEFPTVKTSYWVSRLVKKLQPELQTFHEKHRELLMKHGAVEENGLVELPENKRGIADAEFKELMDQEIELGMQKIEIPEDVSGISAIMLMDLEPFIVLPESVTNAE